MNGKSIVSVQTASDIKDKLFYVRVPELKEQWLGIELSSFWEKTFSKAMPDIGNAEPPTAQEMQQMIREYSLLRKDLTVETARLRQLLRLQSIFAVLRQRDLCLGV